jgi:hypothetical protein
MLTTTKHAAKRELTATPPPRVRVSRQDLEFVSANQQLEGFPGQITEAVAGHEPDMREIVESARRMGAQVPTLANCQRPPIFRTRRNGDQPA